MGQTQTQIKIRTSLTTKLLFLISFLLVTPIVILNLTAITLFQDDKKAYIYDNQASTAVLAGREFVSYLDHGLATLKLVVGGTDFSQVLTQQVKNNIQFYLDNQQTLLGVKLSVFYEKKQQPQAVYGYELRRLIDQLGIPASSLNLEFSFLIQNKKELESGGVFFKNISKPGLPPLLAVMIADPTRLSTKGYLPIAIGFINLKHFLAGAAGSFNRFLIVDKRGELLFHSDVKMLYTQVNLFKDAVFQEAWNNTITSGTKEYFTQEGVRTLGSFYKPGLDLVAITQIDYDKAMKATYTLTEKFVVLAIGSLGVMILLALIFSKRLTAPIYRLFLATTQVSSGKFDIKIPVTSHDEIGALTQSFVAMSRKISDLIHEMVDKVRVDQELEIAKTVQQSLFPQPLIQNEDLIIASHYQSATECGGDWWGYFKAGRKHIFAIADATGHGLPSALMTASARSCFSVLEKLTSDLRFSLNPAEMLEIANRVVFDSAQGNIMMTFFTCIVDIESHLITYASAAHNPPWLFTEQEGRHQMISLIASGKRLGETREVLQPYEIKTMPLKLNDTIVFYTDGLIEGKNLKKVPYGKKQARQILTKNISKLPPAITQALCQDFLAYNAGKELDDDLTLAIVRVLS